MRPVFAFMQRSPRIERPAARTVEARNARSGTPLRVTTERRLRVWTNKRDSMTTDYAARIAEIDEELADERKNEDAPSTAKKQKAPSKDSLQREKRGLEARAERAVITVTIVGKP